MTLYTGSREPPRRSRDALRSAGHARAFRSTATRTATSPSTWGANQRITVDQALQVNTMNGAYASHEEAVKGSITPGKLADFVVLADDPHTVDVEKIKDIQIVRTVVGGSTAYQV